MQPCWGPRAAICSEMAFDESPLIRTQCARINLWPVTCNAQLSVPGDFSRDDSGQVDCTGRLHTQVDSASEIAMTYTHVKLYETSSNVPHRCIPAIWA